MREAYYQDEWVTQYCSDALSVLRELPDSSIDLLATDPPYGIGFMGKDWDRALPDKMIWAECLRVLKPGAFAFVMSIPRSDCQARMVINIQDVGFEVGFTPIYWAYASGFPKAQNIGKAVDKRLGAEREVIGKDKHWGKAGTSIGIGGQEWDITIPSTSQAKALDGSYGGFQPKPALECIFCAQKPLTLEAECSIITSQALKLLEVVIQCTDVNNAVKNTLGDMASIVQGRVTAKSIEEAKAQIGKVGGQYELTAMLGSILAKMGKDIALTHWNTGLLWKSILVDLLSQMNKFTISMITELIIELRTLNSLIYASIQENTTTLEKTRQNGLRLNVGIVESILASALIKLLSLNHTIVPTNATLNICTPKQGISVEDADRNLSPTIQNENTVPPSVTGNIDTRVIIVAMKPLSEKTFVDQALKNGKGITWLDSCRIPYESEGDKEKALLGDAFKRKDTSDKGWSRPWMENQDRIDEINRDAKARAQSGRFPANLLVNDDVLNDGRERTSGRLLTHHKRKGQSNLGKTFEIKDRTGEPANWGGDSGSFSRYFDLDKWAQKTFPFLIVPKASKSEKNKGCEDLPLKLMYKHDGSGNSLENYGSDKPRENNPKGLIPQSRQNFHPTVKPLKLMSYLITLGSREGDTVLDPFLGSGTTALSCKMLGRKCIGIEIEERYCEIAAKRCSQMVFNFGMNTKK